MSFDIDYRYLKAFHQTALHLNFSKAATELNIAQSAISRQVKLLEESMGEQLIVRSSKKVLLTQKGKDLLKAIESFEENTLKITKNTGPQLIRVGILHGLLENWFIQIIKDFVKKTTHELKIEVDTPHHLKQSLVQGKYDLIFTPENIQSELITSLKLFDEKLVIISKEDIDPKKLENYTWITYGESDFFFDLCKKHSKQIISITSMTSIIKLVKENVGVAIVPFHTIKKEDHLHAYEVKGLQTPKIYTSSLNYQTLPEHLEQLINIIKSYTII